MSPIPSAPPDPEPPLLSSLWLLCIHDSDRPGWHRLLESCVFPACSAPCSLLLQILAKLLLVFNIKMHTLSFYFAVIVDFRQWQR